MRHAMLLLAAIVVLLCASPISAQGGAATAAVSPDLPQVQVVIWQVNREGFKPVKHAWIVGKDLMLRLSYDGGATWYAFKPVFADSQAGMLAVEGYDRQDLGRGEFGWVKRLAVTLLSGQTGRATIPVRDTEEKVEFGLQVLEFKTVAQSELNDVSIASAITPDQGGGSHCCVTCGLQQACDCSACIPGCGQCCKTGCYCVVCGS